jgi:hypothetical protein
MKKKLKNYLSGDLCKEKKKRTEKKTISCLEVEQTFLWKKEGKNTWHGKKK